jgi:hypothetical protein
LTDGDIHGGRGTTVGQNETYIVFDHIHNGQAGNILFNANNLVIQTDGIAVMSSSGTSAGTTAYDGDYISEVDYTNIDHVSDLDVQWNTEYGIVTDLSIDWNSESASWNVLNLPVPNSISWTDNTTGVATSHTIRQMIHGIGT